MDFLKYVHHSSESNACSSELQRLHRRFLAMKKMEKVRNSYMLDMLRDEEKKKRAEKKAERKW